MPISTLLNNISISRIISETPEARFAHTGGLRQSADGGRDGTGPRGGGQQQAASESATAGGTKAKLLNDRRRPRRCLRARERARTTANAPCGG